MEFVCHGQSTEGNLSDSYKDIIAYLDASSYAEERLEVAAALAQQHGAKLTGVDISTHAGFPRQMARPGRGDRGPV